MNDSTMESTKNTQSRSIVEALCLRIVRVRSNCPHPEEIIMIAQCLFVDLPCPTLTEVDVTHFNFKFYQAFALPSLPLFSFPFVKTKSFLVRRHLLLIESPSASLHQFLTLSFFLSERHCISLSALFCQSRFISRHPFSHLVFITKPA